MGRKFLLVWTFFLFFVFSKKANAVYYSLSDEQIRQLPMQTMDSIDFLLGAVSGTVWVYARIYEYEIGLVKVGQTVEVRTQAYPDRVFPGVIKSIDPILDRNTRTLRARVEVPNPDWLLKHEMYVDADIKVNLGMKLAVPEEAILDSGTRQMVFVKTGAGKYEPREVKMGARAQGYREVVSGLAEGEEVVTSGNFLIDSESKLKSATQNMGSGHKHGEEKK